MMRILYVQPGHGVGGAAVSLYNLVRSLPAADCSSQVALQTPMDSVYVRMFSGCVEKVHILPYLPTWNKGPIRGFKNRFRHEMSKFKLGWYVWPTLQLSRIIIREQIDMVHTNSGICPVGALAAWLTHRPHVWHVREPLGTDGEFPLILGDRLSANLFKRLSRAIVCNSQYTADFFLRYGVQPRVIYNGINLAEFEDSQEREIALRRRLGLRADVPVVGMVGSVRSKLKEHELFLRAMALVRKQVPNVQFVIFGGSSNPDVSTYARSLHDLASRLQFTVKWADFERDVPAMMRSLDILVHPTSQEGSGRVVMEAMGAGKPVIGVRSGGVQELIQDGETGVLVAPKDPVALSGATINLLVDSTRRRQLGARANAYAREHFSHDVTAASIRALYQEIL